MAAPVRLDILDHLFKRSELFEGFTDLAKQRMGFVGRDKASARQSEQLEPDLILGMAQNLADRRLRDIQAARRGADRTADIYGLKAFDLPDAPSHDSFFGLGDRKRVG